MHKIPEGTDTAYFIIKQINVVVNIETSEG